MIDEKTKKAGGLLAGLGAAWFWFSQATSIIGLVGIIEDLKAWASVATWLMHQVQAVAPLLASTLDAMGVLVHAGLELFRSVFRPVFDFLLGWVPFEIPQFVKDAAVVMVFVLLGRWRTKSKHLDEWRRLNEKGLTDLRDRARAFGLEVSDWSYGKNGALRLQSGVEAHWRLKDDVQDDSYRKLLQDNLDIAVREFGPKFGEFAEQHGWEGYVTPAESRLFEREERALFFVYGLAGVTATTVVVDFIFFR
ncbi:MAG: hypothetical protein R3C27_04565 [Hyphomonadaceae bacterium]